MIAYRISRDELEKLINAEAPQWLTKARTRTDGFRKAKKFTEKTGSIWSQVKPVYMRLQGDSKCAFCERKLESETRGKGEQAVEHFRPKGKIMDWKVPQSLAALGVTVAKAPKDKGGYYLLAYDVFNYSASCNPCNSSLKKMYFPVEGKHNLQGEDPKALSKEQPLLIYPIGDFDADPEDLIGFKGISPCPVGKTEKNRRRAWVTIEFFELDNSTRENLLLERARMIEGVFGALEHAKNPNSSPTMRKYWAGVVEDFQSPKAPHTNCAKSFAKLFSEDHAKASAFFLLARKFVHSKS